MRSLLVFLAAAIMLTPRLAPPGEAAHDPLPESHGHNQRAPEAQAAHSAPAIQATFKDVLLFGAALASIARLTPASSRPAGDGMPSKPALRTAAAWLPCQTSLYRTLHLRAAIPLQAAAHMLPPRRGPPSLRLA